MSNTSPTDGWKFKTKYVMKPYTPYQKMTYDSLQYAELLTAFKKEAREQIERLQEQLRDERESGRLLQRELGDKDKRIEELEKQCESLRDRIARIKGEEYAEDWASDMLKKAREDD